jgi:NADP-dependent 3-hydroxy acid dehydrogenase YdfG
MKNICITGGSRGLGKAICDYFKQNNHNVMSWDSRYDLRNYDIRQKIYTAAIDCDIFISVAKPDFIQTELLYELYKKWQNKDKIIVSIGSAIIVDDFWGENIDMMRYHTQKKSLDHAVKQLQRLQKLCQVHIINPQHLYDNKNYNYKALNEWCEQNLSMYNE